nr:WUSCHEL-related homeobox 11-like [Ipomoea batatas]
MEDYQDSSSSTSSPKKNNTPERNEGVRSRWNPKPEQILILESIFNSGMVNPPKEETVRIRKLLEKFGAVGDANVFYWFQNRRSRSRRRQRQLQLQATLGPPPATADHPTAVPGPGAASASSSSRPPSDRRRHRRPPSACRRRRRCAISSCCTNHPVHARKRSHSKSGLCLAKVKNECIYDNSGLRHSHFQQRLTSNDGMDNATNCS